MSAEMTVFVPYIMMERVIKTIFFFTRCFFSLLVVFICLFAIRFPVVFAFIILFIIIVVFAAVRKLVFVATVVVIFFVLVIILIIVILSFILKPVIFLESI